MPKKVRHKLAASAQSFFHSGGWEVRALRASEAKGNRRVLRFVGSTEQVARDGMIIKTSAWDTREYDKNPVVLYSHDYWGLPIGKSVAVDRNFKDRQLVFDIQFARKSENEFADQVYRLARAGLLRAVSVGFLVKESREANDEEKKRGAHSVVTEAELLELSVVSVPADTDALLIGKGVRMGLVQRSDVDFFRQLRKKPYKAPKGEKGSPRRSVVLRSLANTEAAMGAAFREHEKRMGRKRALAETEVDFRFDIREPELFDPETLTEAEYEADPPVLLTAGVLLDSEDGAIVAQTVHYPNDSWELEDAEAHLEASMDALMEWSGATEEEPTEDEPTEDEPVESEEDGGDGPTMIEVPDDIQAEIDEAREEELTQDAETLRAIAEALSSAAETINAVADDVDPSSGEPTGTEPTGDETPEEVEQSAMHAMASAVNRLSAGTLGGKVRAMVEVAVREALTEMLTPLTEQMEEMRAVLGKSRIVTVRPGKTRRRGPKDPKATPDENGPSGALDLSGLKKAAEGRSS